MITLIRGLMLLLIIVPFSSLKAEAIYLKSDEIKKLIAGRSMTFYGSTGPFKYTGAAHWNKNGTIKGYTTYLSKNRARNGTWYVKNNQYCRKLTGSGKVDFKCHKVQKVNSNTIRFIKPDGSVSSTSVLN